MLCVAGHVCRVLLSSLGGVNGCRWSFLFAVDKRSCELSLCFVVVWCRLLLLLFVVRCCSLLVVVGCCWLLVLLLMWLLFDFVGGVCRCALLLVVLLLLVVSLYGVDGCC